MLKKVDRSGICVKESLQIAFNKLEMRRINPARREQHESEQKGGQRKAESSRTQFRRITGVFKGCQQRIADCSTELAS